MLQRNQKIKNLQTNSCDRSSSFDLRKIGLNPNFWYPLAQSKELKKEKPHQVSFGGEPIVLVRTKSNQIFALEDRCAHRQIPLSMGVVCGEKITCTYHGWQYDQTGKIAKVSYLPKNCSLPKGVKSYPCKEAYNHIFVFPGKVELAETVPFPDIKNWSNNEY
ncbi:MAG: Rieske (2Fe-2S) protein, partial [Trichodesmium sp. St2_bin6]|nr:Rieske (2Fe-2S) protein [Trichodesmium sp. St2_bin6]